MAIMGRYCKAFATDVFKQFPGWSVPGAQAQIPEHLFLHEDLSVTASIFTDEQIVFNQNTPDWELFCRNVLGFSVPNEVSE